ncbi:hypothetical protein PIB30_045714 [Stylosanthes scabra]|uniref:Uncharacterized protein n=1 Tax=Stylosanthes scabra TaxID=79078 RepID=A0ABU6VGY4_9FABA|nr:hypothetical protein [Stylosanthes scabra]
MRKIWPPLVAVVDMPTAQCCWCSSTTSEATTTRNSLKLEIDNDAIVLCDIAATNFALDTSLSSAPATSKLSKRKTKILLEIDKDTIVDKDKE